MICHSLAAFLVVVVVVAVFDAYHFIVASSSSWGGQRRVARAVLKRQLDYFRLLRAPRDLDRRELQHVFQLCNRHGAELVRGADASPRRCPFIHARADGRHCDGPNVAALFHSSGGSGTSRRSRNCCALLSLPFPWFQNLSFPPRLRTIIDCRVHCITFERDACAVPSPVSHCVPLRAPLHALVRELNFYRVGPPHRQWNVVAAWSLDERRVKARPSVVFESSTAASPSAVPRRRIGHVLHTCSVAMVFDPLV